MPADHPSATSNPQTRRRRRFLFGALIALCAGFVYVGVLDLLNIADDLQAGQDRLESIDLETVRQQGIEGVLDDAATHFDDADDRANSSPVLRALSGLPILGDQVVGVRALTGAAQHLGDEARQTGAAISDALDATTASPRARIDLLDTVVAEIDRIETVAATTRIDTDGLIGPLQSAKTDVEEGLAEVPNRFVSIRGQLAALRTLLDGPTRYMVLAGNNAEMRPGGGMPLSAGAATFTGGEIKLGEFIQTVSPFFHTTPDGGSNAGLVLDQLRAAYPYWQIGVHPTATAVNPNFPVSAPMQANIARDAVGFSADGVVQIDALALSSILGVIGPVTYDGIEYNAKNLPQLVLNQAYIDFEEGPNRERYEAQGELAQTIFEAIQTRDIDLLDLVATLQDAAAGRHLMVWSSDPVLQDLYESLGVSGRFSNVGTMVSLANTGANKLDFYVYPEVRVDTTPLVDDEWLVTMTARVVHPDRDFTVGYIEGNEPDLAGGQYRGMVVFQLPQAATDVQLEGGNPTENGFDGTSQIIGTRIVVPKGSETVVTARYRLPRAFAGMLVQPSARILPVAWTVNGVPYNDAVPFFAGFGAFPDPESTTARMTRMTGGFIAVGSVLFSFAAWRRRRRSDAPIERIRAAAALDRRTAAGLVAVAVALVIAASFL